VDNLQWLSHQQHMAEQGTRRLLVISGEAVWCQQQALTLAATLAGDWHWISPQPHSDYPGTPASKVRSLLGQQILHGVFDASQGLDVEALAAFTGTLRAGSWLLLLVPAWQGWPQQADHDSLRWSESPEPIKTPHFITHLQRQLLLDGEVAYWQQGQLLQLPPTGQQPTWLPPNGEPTAEQQQILSQLLAAKQGIWVVTAARGRGKSTLAGMLVAQTPGVCWLTAPNQAATAQIQQQAGQRAVFYAPDALLAACQAGQIRDVDWLLVDEAAAIPGPLLQQLIGYFPRVLLTTTVQGYEGTGQGFLLKFCASLPQWQGFTLQRPLRWAPGDPLERVINNALLLAPTEPSIPVAERVQITAISQTALCASPALLQDFYSLLTSAHYRTTPLDLRRLMDAPGMHFAFATQNQTLMAAIWLVDEGGLDAALSHDIWAGRRRPRGNLVAQSLAAHGSQWQAPTLFSRRISRIAVLAACRQQGVAQELVAQQQQLAIEQQLDFLSVSFGYTEPLWRFWQRCGFQLVRMGSQREASSGCYTAMALLPLSAAGGALCSAEQHQLSRDWPWLQMLINEPLNVAESADQQLDHTDWQNLAGFAFAHRPLSACIAALQRLLLASPLPLAALRQQLQNVPQPNGQQPVGRKSQLLQWRQETATALLQQDPEACRHWQQWVQTGH